MRLRPRKALNSFIVQRPHCLAFSIPIISTRQRTGGLPRLRKALDGVVMCRVLARSLSENLPSGPRWILIRSGGFISGSANGMNEKEKEDIPSKGTFSGVGWDVCEDLRDYTEVRKSS